METVFWACFIGGALYAIVVILFDDIIGAALDSLVPDIPGLDAITLVGGITVFGGTGLLLDHYTDLGTGTVLLLSLLSAIVAGAAVFFLYVRPMRDSENSTGYSEQDMTGMLAEVLVPIPASGYGEVMLRMGPAGVTGRIAASLDGEPIEAGADVLVVEVRDGTLYVTKVDMDRFDGSKR